MSNEVAQKKEKQTIFSNKSGCEVDKAISKVHGKSGEFEFQIVSSVTKDSAAATLYVSVGDIYDRADVLGLIDKWATKLEKKFSKKYPSVKLNSDSKSVSFQFDGIDFVTSVRPCLKMQREAARICKKMFSVHASIRKQIETKENRKSGRKARAEAIEAAEAVPGAESAE